MVYACTGQEKLQLFPSYITPPLARLSVSTPSLTFSFSCPCAIHSGHLSDNSKDGIERPRPYSYRPHAEVLNLIGNLEVCGDDKLVSLSLSGRAMDTSMLKRAFLDDELWSPGENSAHIFTFHPLSTRIHTLYMCMQPCRCSFSLMLLSPFR